MHKRALLTSRVGDRQLCSVNCSFLMVHLSFVFYSCPCLTPLLFPPWGLMVSSYMSAFKRHAARQAAHGFWWGWRLGHPWFSGRTSAPAKSTVNSLVRLDGSGGAGSGCALDIEPNAFCKQQLNEDSCHEQTAWKVTLRWHHWVRGRHAEIGTHYAPSMPAWCN